MTRTSRTAKKQAFLEAYRDLGTVSGAARRIGVHRQRLYAWRQADAAFAAQWAEVEAEVADDLEQEAIRRAKEGSDTLLIFLLKGLKPERYRERVEHHSGPEPVRVVITHVNDWRQATTGDAEGDA